MADTATAYAEILSNTRNTIHDLTLLDDDGSRWRLRYYGVDYMLMYMPCVDITYIHTAYRDCNAKMWLPGEVVAYFYGKPDSYDFTQEMHTDRAARYREHIAELKEELDNVTNNYSRFILQTQQFVDALDKTDEVVEKFNEWLQVY